MNTLPKSQSILLIDDSITQYLMLQALVKGKNWQIAHASSLEVAQERLEAITYDLILLDLHFPTGSATQFLVQTKRTCPVVVVTGSSEPDKWLAVLQEGASDLVLKPFNFVALTQRIQFWLSQEDLSNDPGSTFDQIEAQKLISLMGAGDWLQTVSLFADISRDALKQLKLNFPNHEDLKRLAHTMKGEAPIFGAKQLGFHGKRIERMFNATVPIDFEVELTILHTLFQAWEVQRLAWSKTQLTQ